MPAKNRALRNMENTPLLERVAVAIAEADGCYAYAPSDCQNEVVWKEYAKQAKAAIKAIQQDNAQYTCHCGNVVNVGEKNNGI